MTKTYAEADLNAALVAMVDRITEAIHKNYTGPTGGWLVSPKTMVDIIEKELLPTDIVASVERERKRLQLEARKAQLISMPQFKVLADYDIWQEQQLATLEAELNKEKK